MFGINGGEVLVLLVVAVIVVGPERLPAYAEQLGAWARQLRAFVGTAKERVASELGDEAADVDWTSLDPRRYDPRRIVREALLDEVAAPPVTGRQYTTRGAAARAAGAAGAATTAADAAAAVEPRATPFDDEAT